LYGLDPVDLEEKQAVMRSYEHTFIARQDLSPQQAQALADSYAGVITEHGGEVTKNEYWGLRNLAYRIKKNRKGHYLHLNLRAPSAAVDELERQERLSDDVIRYLTVRVDELDDSPSIIMQVRSSREERSRRPHDDGPRRHDGERRPHDDDGGPRRHEGERRPHDGDRPRRAAEPRPTESRPAEPTDGEASGEAAGDDQ
jgi:small subunit ribosomal protein S6